MDTIIISVLQMREQVSTRKLRSLRILPGTSQMPSGKAGACFQVGPAPKWAVEPHPSAASPATQFPVIVLGRRSLHFLSLLNTLKRTLHLWEISSSGHNTLKSVKRPFTL